jgi:hypothetical protein
VLVDEIVNGTEQKLEKLVETQALLLITLKLFLNGEKRLPPSWTEAERQIHILRTLEGRLLLEVAVP